MSGSEPGLEYLYASALREHLAGASEAALRRASELGSKAAAEGRGILDVVNAHDEATKGILGGTNAEISRKMAAMNSFLLESLSPFESRHRSFRETNAALRRLNATLEEETKRIAHVLHDDATQLLAAAHIALADLARELPAKHGERAQEIRYLLDQIGAQLRRLSHELRPTILDDLGLLPAIEFLAEGITKRTGLPIVVQGSTNGRLPPSIETALYRIVQEGLANAARHSRATRAVVQLTREPRRLHCAIRDNGVGFDPRQLQGEDKDRRGVGLIAIRERLNALGGTLQINSSSQRGTELSIMIAMEG